MEIKIAFTKSLTLKWIHVFGCAPSVCAKDDSISSIFWPDLSSFLYDIEIYELFNNDKNMIPIRFYINHLEFKSCKYSRLQFNNFILYFSNIYSLRKALFVRQYLIRMSLMQITLACLSCSCNGGGNAKRCLEIWVSCEWSIACRTWSIST